MNKLKVKNTLDEKCRTIADLKQQLKDTEESYNNTMRYLNKTRSELLNLPKKILKDIQENFDWKQCCEIRKYYDQQYIWFNYVAFNDFLDTILKKFEGYELIGYCSYRDTETGVVGDNFVGVLNEQDQKIKELQQQLAEHNEFFNAFACKDFNEFKDFILTFMLTPHEEQTLIRELKQQLHDLPKKIVEEIRKTLNGNDIEIENNIWLTDILDTILKKYGGEDESLCCNVKQ